MPNRPLTPLTAKEPVEKHTHNRSARLVSRRVLRVVVVLLLTCLLVPPVWNLGSALTKNDGLSVAGKVAEWARNHQLGAMVDIAERFRYRNPPSDSEASRLPIEVIEATGTTLPEAFNPPSLTPVHLPALNGEGVWQVARHLSGTPVAWITSLRPSSRYAAITATHVLIDQRKLRAVLHNGTTIPGGRDWQHGNSLSPLEVATAVFAFNGAFRLEHSGGGYFTENRVVRPLVQEVASLAIDALGQIRIGRWGVELDPLGSNGREWISVRQNLQLLVVDGQLSPLLNQGYWGGDKKGNIYILRSAICERFDGMILFTIMGMSDATSLAGAMRDAGCRYAMQLDQNESYPRGYVFESGIPRKIDSRMRGRVDDFIRGYSRDFFVYLEKP